MFRIALKKRGLRHRSLEIGILIILYFKFDIFKKIVQFLSRGSQVLIANYVAFHEIIFS